MHNKRSQIIRYPDFTYIKMDGRVYMVTVAGIAYLTPYLDIPVFTRPSELSLRRLSELVVVAL